MRSPTQYSLALLEKFGCEYRRVLERWAFQPTGAPMIVRLLVRQDHFSCDVEGITEGGDTFRVQCSSRSNHAARRAKLLAEPALRAWIKCSMNHVWVLSVGTRKRDGKEYTHLWVEEMKLGLDGQPVFEPVDLGKRAWIPKRAPRKPRIHGPSEMLRALYGMGEPHGD